MIETSPPRPFFEITGFRFRFTSLIALIAAGLLMEGGLRLGRVPATYLYQHGPESWDGRVWIYVGLAILFQALVGLIGIGVMKLILPRAEAHLRWPPGRSYTRLALILGVAIGVIMLFADYWPEMLAGGVLDATFPVNPVDSAGWLGALAITGLAEETIFRGLMVGALVIFMPGRVRAGDFDIPLAGVAVALLFGAAHWQSFIHDPLHTALAQQIYAFAWGLIYVWLMERSRSLLAPIIAHGAGNFTEIGLVMLWTVSVT